MKPETIIKLIAVFMILYGINLKTNFISFGQTQYEYAQVIEAKTVGTSAIATGYFYHRNGETNTLRLLLPNGKTIPLDIGQKPLPDIGSSVQLKVRTKIFGSNSYEYVDRGY